MLRFCYSVDLEFSVRSRSISASRAALLFSALSTYQLSRSLISFSRYSEALLTCLRRSARERASASRSFSSALRRSSFSSSRATSRVRSARAAAASSRRAVSSRVVASWLDFCSSRKEERLHISESFSSKREA